jgi:hypothetical protein
MPMVQISTSTLLWIVVSVTLGAFILYLVFLSMGGFGHLNQTLIIS